MVEWTLDFHVLISPSLALVNPPTHTSYQRMESHTITLSLSFLPFKEWMTVIFRKTECRLNNRTFSKCLSDLHRRDCQEFQSWLPKPSAEKKQKQKKLCMCPSFSLALRNNSCQKPKHGVRGHLRMYFYPLWSPSLFFFFFLAGLEKLVAKMCLRMHTHMQRHADTSADACVRRTLFSHAEGQQRPKKTETTTSDREAVGRN